MTTSHHINANMLYIETNNWHVDELKVSCNDNVCKLLYKTHHYKSYHNDIKYNMTLSTICDVAIGSP